MSTDRDPLVGTWTLNPSRSAFDVHHRPQAATLVIERDDAGGYVIKAHGISEKGQPCTEATQTLVPDGRPRPVPNLPGLAMISTRPDVRTIHTDVRREDGSIAGQSTYAASLDGRSLTAITSGFDSQLRQFKQQTSWDRQ